MAGDAHGHGHHGHGAAAEGAEKGLSYFINSNTLFGRRNTVIAVLSIYATGIYLWSSSKKNAAPEAPKKH
eukprot:m.27869 g.27869  ORF g.27869 m.27869 type:complete len:70 (+) comp4463_c0_seq1:1685-1894(+)